MEQLEIKKEIPPQRCEICHQSDCFDSINNFCTRCSNIDRPKEPILESKKVFQQYFFAMSIPKLVVMSIFSLNLYQIYWFYKNWDFINDRKKASMRPGLRAIFLLFFCYPLFREIKKTSKELGIKSNLIPSLSAIVFIFFKVLDNFDSILALLTFLSIIPLISVQQLINEIHQKTTPDIPIDSKYSAINIVLIILGGIVLTLAIIGILFQEPNY